MNKNKMTNFGELTRDGFAGIDPHTVAVVPVGAIEQHGAHLPVNTDSLILEHILISAAQACSQPVIITPMIQYGYSPHHFCYPGVLSLQSETILALLKDIGVSLVRSGFSRILIITGHGGNMHVIGQAARDIGCLNPGVIAASTSYWDIAKDRLKKRMSGLTEWIPGHAGLFETSLVMALRGDLVDLSRLSDVSIDEKNISKMLFTDLAQKAYFERHNYHLLIQGTTDSIINASKELGESILSVICQELADFLDKFSLHV
jgi:creatinine amidohydrolase